jgi:chemotaxis protein MotA
MIGTVLGLIGMFASMGSPAQMGPAMALALLTTLYGLFLGNIVFGPLADRLERLSEAELAWQQATAQRLERFARDEGVSTSAWLQRHRKVVG